MKTSRRQLIRQLGIASLFLTKKTPAIAAEVGKTKKHTFVIIILNGGVDHSQFLPVFDSSDRLSRDIHFPSQETFETNGYRLLNVPKVLTPSSPLISRFGSRLAIISGIQMDGQNSHNGALRVFMRGSGEGNVPTLASVMGELTGQDTRYGVISFGVQPFQNASNLSEKGVGLSLPNKISLFADQLHLPNPIGNLSSERFLDLVTGYVQSHPESDLNHMIKSPKSGSELSEFRSIFRNAGAKKKQEFINNFVLTPDYWNPYEGLAGPYGSERHEQFAMTAKLIKDGSFASSFVLNLGLPEGFHSYDTHNAYSGNNDFRQQEKLDRDLRAIEIFLSQIESSLDHTTVIIGSEFGRPPALNPTGGRDHWGANNTMLVLSPFIKSGLYGSVDPSTYIGNGVLLGDGSRSPMRCASIYRGFLETVFARGLVNGPQATANSLYRQFLPGPLPKGLFDNA